MSQGYLRHIAQCARHDTSRFIPFLVADKKVGAMRRDYAPLLSSLEGFSLDQGALRLTPGTGTARTRTIARAADLLSRHHNVPLVGEIYPVIEEWGEKPLAEIDRAAIPWFGTRGFGVHVNGFVRKPDGLHLWIARRAASRKIDPGKLDNMIGGGLPIGLTPEENLAKEAWEEAGLPSEIARAALPHGSLRYRRDMMKGVRNDSLFIYDLEMPDGLIPKNTDGEVESFTLLPAAKVAEIVAATDDFKFNCNLVMIDFFLRRNVIAPDHPQRGALEEAMRKVRA